MKERVEYQQLVDEIRRHNDLYYNQDAPEISDFEYDALMRQLKEIEREHPEYITSDSPTQKVGGKRVMGIPVQHKVPMLSLEDVFSLEDVRAFVRSIKEIDPLATFSVEQKIDGLSLSLEYHDGKLIRASTRGDGFEGEDVTENARHIQGIPLTIHPPYILDQIDGYFEVRGECYMSYAAFEDANRQQAEHGKKLFANARNCAAGTLRQADPAVVEQRGLEVLIFNVQQPNVALSEHSHGSQLNLLEEWGFACAPRGTFHDENGVVVAIEKIGSKRSSLPYSIDGAVVKVNSHSLRQRLGERTKTPRWAVAFKYPPEEKETTLINIRLQTGRTGKVTPVAEFEPVMLAGTTVSNATLHNQGRIDELALNIGDTIVVRKAGDIIPEIVRVTRHASQGKAPFQMRTCPVCGRHLAYEGDDGADMFCTNPYCEAKRQRQLEFFASRDCMDIDGLGPNTIAALIAKNLVNRPSDLYDLFSFPFTHLSEVLGGEKIAENLLNNIEKSKTQDAVRVLKALGWKNVGAHVSKALLEKYGSIGRIFDTPVDQLQADMAQMLGFGNILIQAVISMVLDENMREEVSLLSISGVNMDYRAVSAGDKLAGKTFVVTGTLPTMDRKTVQSLIEQNGGKVSGSVSKNTSYLVAGEAAGSKLTKAQSLGVSIITEAELLAMLEGGT